MHVKHSFDSDSRAPLRKNLVLSSIERLGAAYGSPVMAEGVGTGWCGRISAPPAPAALRHALAALLSRHAALQAPLTEEASGPGARRHPSMEAEPELVDGSAWSESELHARAVEFLARPFDMKEGPRLRVALLGRAEGEHVLCFAVHPFAVDTGGFAQLVDELLQGYCAGASGSRLSAAPEDLSEMPRSAAVQPPEEATLSYWQKRLEGAPFSLHLPLDRARSAGPSLRGATHRLALPAGLTGRLRQVAEEEGATVEEVVLAAFGVLLSRYSRQDEVLVGAVTGTGEGEGHPAILRVDLAAAPPFRTLLRHVRQQLAEARGQGVYSLSALANRLQLAREPGRPLLFQAFFHALQAQGPVREEVLSLLFGPKGQRRRVGGWEVETVCGLEGPTMDDVTLLACALPGGMELLLRYRPELFQAATMARMVGHLGVLLEAIAATPDCQVTGLPLVGAEERQQLLTLWSGPEASHAQEGCIHELFTAQVRAAPSFTALVSDGQRLTYSELDARANQLAHALRRRGVGPDVCVAVSVDRSPELVVALLGVLKAGGAFVVLDPSYPIDRLQYMLADSAAPVLLTEEKWATRFASYAGAVLRLDTEGPEISREPAEAPNSGVTPAHLAYAVYTSGTTGRPRGVLVEHAALANMVLHRLPLLGLRRDSRVLQVCAPSFDAALSEIFTTLLAGAELHMAREEALAPGMPLHDTLAQRGIHFVSAPPTMLTATPCEDLTVLEIVDTGAEVCPEATLQRWGQGRRMVIGYGPSEVTIQASCAVSTQGPLKVGTIGRAMPHRRMYVLGPDLGPVPVGLTGELFIGGVGLSRGYHRIPELTAERFLPDPFSSVSGARMYRTGDLVRVVADGSLDFVGRVDHQVKVRGHRIELGEIEACLGRHPALKEVVVLAREDVTGQKRLVAYATAEGTPNPSDVRAFLKEQLPDYMVPAAFVLLEVFPRTPSGKLDRASLPPPLEGQPEPARSYTPPRTPMEEKLATIWCKVLGLDKVSVHDDFLEAGGDSILSLHVVSRAKRAGLTFTIKEFQLNPTIAALAAYLEGGARGTTPAPVAQTAPAAPATPAAEVPRSATTVLPPGAFPVTMWQQTHWMLRQLSPQSEPRGAFAFRILSALEVPRLRRALQGLVRHHPTLRTTFGATKGIPFQQVHEEARLDFEEVDASGWSEEELLERLYAERKGTFDLARGPLVRFRLFRRSATEAVLLKVAPHILMDGGSMRVLLRDLGLLYAADSQVALPAVERHFHEYVQREARMLAGEEGARHLDFWKEELAGHSYVLEVPTDRPRSKFSTRPGRDEPLHLAPELVEALQALARSERISLFTVLLAAFELVLHHASGQADILVGCPVSVRPPEFEELVGYCLNLTVLRSRLEGDPSFRDFLHRTRERQKASLEHSDYPFPALLDKLRVPRDPSRPRLVQAAINHNTSYSRLQGLEDAGSFRDSLQEGERLRLELAGLVGEILPMPEREAQFDLELSIIEGGGGLLPRLQYNTDLFERETVQALGRNLLRLLEAVVIRPDERLSRLTADFERRGAASQ